MRALLLAFFVSSAAVADGAFPNAMQVLARESEPLRVQLGTTFGLAFTEDASANWRYVCEPWVTSGAGQIVSLYALQADGALLALSDKLTRSTDHGCTWSTIPGPATGGNWMDVFADARDPARALGIAWTSTRSGVWISTDGAQTFSTQLLDTAERVDSVESAASDPAVIYAATAVFGLPDAGAPTAALFRTIDGGSTWQRSDLAVQVPVALRILLVSPTDPKTVWLRATDLSGTGDELFVSTDGGQSFTSLLRSSRPFTGFARGADGTLFVADLQAGVLVRAPTASSFTRLPGPHLLCLFLSGSRLFGCADGLQEPYNLAASDDSGRSWKRLLQFVQLQGPATCPQVQNACADDWVYEQALFAGTVFEPAPSGCGCRTAGAGGWLLLAFFLAARRATRRRAEG